MLSGRLRACLIRLIGDRDGVSAIEFSVIAPILLLILMGSIELPRAYMIGKRLDNAASTMADLISRGSYADLKPVSRRDERDLQPLRREPCEHRADGGGDLQRRHRGDDQGLLQCRIQRPGPHGGLLARRTAPGMTRNGDRFVVSEVTMIYHPIFPVLSKLTGWTFRYKKIWPVRGGEIYNGQNEVVLPGGKPCPA
ncbi:TadE/TadG family type IV pilus assembly protein [Methylobacterium oryzae CBMB20]